MPNLKDTSTESETIDRDIAPARDQLLSVQAQIVTSQAQIEDEINDFDILGLDSVRERCDLLRSQLVEQQKVELDLASSINRAEARLAEIEAEGQRQADIERRLSIPRLKQEKLASAARVQQAAEALGVAMRTDLAAAAQLVTAAGTIDAARVLSLRALSGRYANSLWLHFSVDPAASSGSGDLTFLPLAHNQFSPESRRPLVDVETALLDSAIPLYGSRAEAERAQLRADPTGTTVHVVQDDAGVFQLRTGVLRGRSAAAQAKAESE